MSIVDLHRGTVGGGSVTSPVAKDSVTPEGPPDPRRRQGLVRSTPNKGREGSRGKVAEGRTLVVAVVEGPTRRVDGPSPHRPVGVDVDHDRPALADESLHSWDETEKLLQRWGRGCPSRGLVFNVPVRRAPRTSTPSTRQTRHTECTVPVPDVPPRDPYGPRTREVRCRPRHCH